MSNFNYKSLLKMALCYLMLIIMCPGMRIFCC